MSKVSIRNLCKIYPNAKNVAPAVKDFNLDIDDGEFIVLVGPSGCGKTTTLRMIAGLESVTSGEIYIDDKLINNLSPKDRNIAMVFQNYALYPNLDLFENMAFGLRLRKMEKYKIEETVNNKSKQLQIDHLLDRLPKDVSGGQRQRAALGRAIVRNPKVFLMDEPLSNLDAKMRVQMRVELIRLHRQLKATTIYVTHDQIEAMTMGDRIVIMNWGEIQQIGTPEEIYNYPVNRFVGGFIGSPAMNFIEGRIVKSGDGLEFFNGRLGLKIPKENEANLQRNYIDNTVFGGIRPEYMTIKPYADRLQGENSIRAKVEVTELIGADRYVYASIGDTDQVVIRVPSRERYDDGSIIEVSVDMGYFLYFDQNTGKRII